MLTSTRLRSFRRDAGIGGSSWPPVQIWLHGPGEVQDRPHRVRESKKLPTPEVSCKESAFLETWKRNNGTLWLCFLTSKVIGIGRNTTSSGIIHEVKNTMNTLRCTVFFNGLLRIQKL